MRCAWMLMQFLGFFCGGADEPSAKEGRVEKKYRHLKEKAKALAMTDDEFKAQLEAVAQATAARIGNKKSLARTKGMTETELLEKIMRDKRIERMRRRREERRRRKEQERLFRQQAAEYEATGDIARAMSMYSLADIQRSDTQSILQRSDTHSMLQRSGTMSMMHPSLQRSTTLSVYPGADLSQSGSVAPMMMMSGMVPPGADQTGAFYGMTGAFRQFESKRGPRDRESTLLALSYPARIAEMVRQVITRPLMTVTEEQLKQGYLRDAGRWECLSLRAFVNSNLRHTGKIAPAKDMDVPLTTHLACFLVALTLSVIPFSTGAYGFVGYM